MAVYTKQTWADKDTRYPVSAARMMYMEDGIQAANAAADQAVATANASAATVATKASIGMAIALGG